MIRMECDVMQRGEVGYPDQSYSRSVGHYSRRGGEEKERDKAMLVEDGRKEAEVATVIRWQETRR